MDDLTILTTTKVCTVRLLRKLQENIERARMKIKPSKSRSISIIKGKLSDHRFHVGRETIPTVSEKPVKSLGGEEWSWTWGQYTSVEQGLFISETQDGVPGGMSGGGSKKVHSSCGTGKARAVDGMGRSGEEEDLLERAVGDEGIQGKLYHQGCLRCPTFSRKPKPMGAVEEAYEWKRLRYAELATNAKQQGWNVNLRPVEVEGS
ncbi:uncharacterized protein LOC124385259 [Tachysurus ichikawai]